MVQLAMLLKSSWDRHDEEGGNMAYGDGWRQRWGNEMLFWFERAVSSEQGPPFPKLMTS